MVSLSNHARRMAQALLVLAITSQPAAAEEEPAAAISEGGAEGDEAKTSE